MRFLPALLLAATAALASPPDNLPPDCLVATHIDFDALRKIEEWGRIREPIAEFLKEGMGLEGLFEGAGMRPETDLASLTFALGGDPAHDTQQLYAIARGTFDADKLAACLTKGGLKATKRDGMTVFEDPTAEGKITCAFHGAFGLLDGGVLLFAEPPKGIDALRAAMNEDAPRSEVSKLLASAPAAHAWTVFAPTPALREAARNEPEGAVFAGLKSAVFAYKLGANLEVACIGEAESEEAAKQLLVVAQAGLLGLGLKDRAKLECSGTALKGSLAIPLEDAMTMMGMPVESAETPGTSARPVVAEGGPKLEGKGKLQRLALPGQVNGLTVSPDGRFVFVDRAQESDVVLDADLRVVGKVRDSWGRMGFALDGKTAIWPRGGAVIRTIPELAKTHEVERPPGRFGDDPWAVCPLAGGKSFVIVDWEGIRLFHIDPPRWGDAGKAAISQPIAGAIDGKTGMLVMIGDDTSFEVFDPAALKSVGTVTLPCTKVTFDVVATGGRAWVGTKDGVILPVDIAMRKALDPVRVADDGDVHLALSSSGRTLAAFADKFVDRDHHPTIAKIYSVEDGALHETATASFVAPCVTFEIALLETRSTVLVAGVGPLVWRYGPEKAD